MARDFNGTNQYLTIGNPAPVNVTGSLLTLFAWVYQDVSPGSHVGILSKHGPGISLHYELRCTGGQDLGFYIGDGGGDEGVSGGSIGVGVWTALAGRKNGTGTNSLQCWQDGVLAAQMTSGRSMNSLGHSLNIGANSGGSYTFDGKIAHAAVWAAALDDAELIALAKGFSPMLIRPALLRGYWPLLGNDSPEPDPKNGSNATLVNAPPKFDGPRIIMPSPAIYAPV